MSTISASTTSTTAYVVTADTTGTLVLKTGSTPTTAVTIGTDQSVTFAGALTATGVGALTINKSAAAGTASLVFANSPSGDGVGRINFQTSNSVTNWSINTNTVIGGELNFTPSTAGGGTTFTTAALTISSASNVGIGVTTPGSYRLYVKTSTDKTAATGYPFILSSNDTNSFDFIIERKTNAYYKIQAVEQGIAYRPIAMQTDGGELTIGTASNIGVGAKVAILSSGNVLHVQSSSNASNNIVSYNSGGTATFSVSATGAVSKASGSFRIDHPLPELEATHQLVHSFVEAPQADNIYRGKATLENGVASINIDTNSGMTEGTFVLLNREVQCFTTNETGWGAVRGSVAGNILTIEAQDNTCADTISWLVIGERQDKHMMDTDWTDENGKVIVEPLKPVQETSVEEQGA